MTIQGKVLSVKHRRGLHRAMSSAPVGEDDSAGGQCERVSGVLAKGSLGAEVGG